MGRPAHFSRRDYTLFLSRLKVSYSAIYRSINLLLTVMLPAYSMLQGETTVFYLVYLYWWHELIASVLDGIYFSAATKRSSEQSLMNPLGGRLFLLAIYFVFIVVFFGLMSSWENDELLKINIIVFFFRDHIFTLTLAGILLNEAWWRHNSPLPIRNLQDPFSGRMLVMHISIIMGAVMSFLVVKSFPNLFTPGNLWGSVLISAPFLLVKAYMGRRMELATQTT
jgi:hypothetical protein